VVSTNPAVDVEWRVEQLRPEEKNEVLSQRRWPGGKGVNVARWLGWSGVRTRLLLPLGGATGRELAAGLRRESIRFRSVPIAGETRANVVVTTHGGPQFRLNPTWPVLTAQELAALESALAEELEGCDWVVFSGALVRGASAGWYARWVRRARKQGCQVVVDCDGDPFRQAVRARPWLVKPNEFELTQWAGRPLPDAAAAELAATELARTTGGWVLVSRGAEGAWLTGPDDGGLRRCPAPATRVRNTVGAGDALLAGAVAAAIRAPGDPGQWLKAGVRAGSLSTQQEPGGLPTAG
jgi:1-phosphofructokinase family hexose kinase